MQGAIKLKRSVRLVLTREQMYGLGYRPATIERVALGAKADGTLDAITHEATAMTSQYEEFSRNDTGWSAQLYKSANANYEHKLDPTRCADAGRHARAGGGDRRLCARVCDGRARGRARARPDGAAASLLLGPRPEPRPSLHQQAIAGVLPPGCRGVRLERAQSRAALDARRHRAGRVGHGHRHLGGAPDADGRPHRADRQRSRRSIVRHLGHRHRHLYGHGAGCRGHARRADREHHGEARRLDAADVAGRGRIVDRGVGRACHRCRRRRGPQGAAEPGTEAAGLTARGPAARRRPCSRTA